MCDIFLFLFPSLYSKHLCNTYNIYPFFILFAFSSQHACFSCPNEACAGGGGEENKYIRLHVAGASEATTVSRSSGDFTCYHCGTQLTEDVSLRALSSKNNNSYRGDGIH